MGRGTVPNVRRAAEKSRQDLFIPNTPLERCPKASLELGSIVELGGPHVGMNTLLCTYLHKDTPAHLGPTGWTTLTWSIDLRTKEQDPSMLRVSCCTLHLLRKSWHPADRYPPRRAGLGWFHQTLITARHLSDCTQESRHFCVGPQSRAVEALDSFSQRSFVSHISECAVLTGYVHD